MTQGITVVTSDTASMRLSSIEATLTDTLYKGFPLVNNLTDLFIDGYVMRIDIMIVLDGARQASPNLDPRTICVFGPEGEVVEEEHETYIYFSSIVDKTPITISPSTPLETAMDYFKLLG
jgi:chloride channel 3/4/5